MFIKVLGFKTLQISVFHRSIFYIYNVNNTNMATCDLQKWKMHYHSLV